MVNSMDKPVYRENDVKSPRKLFRGFIVGWFGRENLEINPLWKIISKVFIVKSHELIGSMILAFFFLWMSALWFFFILSSTIRANNKQQTLESKSGRNQK